MVTCPPPDVTQAQKEPLRRSGRPEEPVKLLLALMLLAAAPSAAQTTVPVVDRWEKDISAFEAADKMVPFPKGGIVFVGSSTSCGHS